MMPRTSVITREELYELVWSAPMIKVAEKFDVSGSYLARVATTSLSKSFKLGRRSSAWSGSSRALKIGHRHFPRWNVRVYLTDYGSPESSSARRTPWTSFGSGRRPSSDTCPCRSAIPVQEMSIHKIMMKTRMATPGLGEISTASAIERYDDFPLRYPVGRQRIPLKPDQTHAARLRAR